MGKSMRREARIFTFLIAFMMIASVFMMPVEADAATYMTPYKVKLTSVKSVDHNAVKITWNKAKYAKKYQVYRATSKNGKYIRVATTTKRSYTNYKLTTGKKYYYKVRAVNGSKYGKFSYKRYAIPKLKKPTFKKTVTATDFTTTLKWNKVNGAKGYIVYRATSSKGSYKKIASTTKLSYTDKKLNPEKAYYYKVKAYKKVNDYYKYSYMSGWKYAKTKKHICNWKVKTNDDAGIEYICAACGNTKYHTHVWESYYDELNELAGFKCSGCESDKSHTHDWSLTEICYVCECGAARPLEHEHEYIPVYGEVDKGSLKDDVRYEEIIYCQVCEQLVGGDIDDYADKTHINSVHDGIGGAYYSSGAEHIYKKWESEITTEIVGYECSVCKELKDHIHAWKAVYENGYYKKVKVYDAWTKCNGCGCDLSKQSADEEYEYIKEHGYWHFETDGTLPGWTYTNRWIYIDVWVDEVIQTGYKCSCGAELSNCEN